mmetsp:Transcript_21440/g.27726  ORF Transcript_21440/g.27726 Transcript_21440/m.27726 type:complete len:122 (+) Transcript_21440:230-595(+)
MNFVSQISRKLPTSSFALRASSRTFATKGGPAVNKLRVVLEEYRQLHYSQETSTRFKKEIVAAACRSSSPDNKSVQVEGIQSVLSNIGAADRLSTGDLKMFFKEAGNPSGGIPASQLIKLL